MNEEKMEKQKFSVDAEVVPDVLQGISDLLLMAQDDNGYCNPSGIFFAVSTLLDYVADDLEASLDSFRHERTELHQLLEQSKESKTVPFPVIKANGDRA